MKLEFPFDRLLCTMAELTSLKQCEQWLSTISLSIFLTSNANQLIAYFYVPRWNAKAGGVLIAVGSRHTVTERILYSRRTIPNHTSGEHWTPNSCIKTEWGKKNIAEVDDKLEQGSDSQY